MKVGTLLVAVLVAVGSLYAAVWMLKADPSRKQATATPAPAAKEDPEAPEVSATGPYPKAVLDETEFAFGAMEAGEERTHMFVVRNEGEAPLKLVKGTTTCKCTLSELAQGEVPPGESAEIELTWKPVAESTMFRQVANILTNDPKRTKIELTVSGTVDAKFHFSPADTWHLHEINESEPTPFTGSIYSTVLDKFQITDLKVDSPFATVKSEPLEAEVLKELHAQSGYSIALEIRPDIPVGEFRFPLIVQTDIRGRKTTHTAGDQAAYDKTTADDKTAADKPDDKISADAAKSAEAAKNTEEQKPEPKSDQPADGDKDGDKDASTDGDKPESADAGEPIAVQVMVTGMHAGPISILGPNWIEDQMTVSLGTFAAKVGKKVTLNLFVRNCPEAGLEFKEVQADPDYIRVSIQPDEKFKGRSKHYHLTFEFPPGSPKEPHLKDNRGKIKITTNHPQAPEINFQVIFNPY